MSDACAQPHEYQPISVDLMEVVVLEFPAPAEWLNANDRLHWAVRNRLTQAWREAATVYARRAGLPMGLRRVHVVVEVCRPRANRADVGNFYPTVKAVVDGLTDYGCWVDDDDSHVVGPDLRRGPKGPAGVRVIIRPL